MSHVEHHAKIRALADALIASHDGGRDHWDTINELSTEECKLLDTMALECGGCNQWFPAPDMLDNGAEYLCAECFT